MKKKNTKKGKASERENKKKKRHFELEKKCEDKG